MVRISTLFWFRLLILGFPSVFAKSAGKVDRDTELVTLDVDLPPDVQRMLDEMCEMEGITPSQMLTRWIDARWDAMGYTDDDFLDVESGANAATRESPTAPSQDSRQHSAGVVADEQLRTASYSRESPSVEAHRPASIMASGAPSAGRHSDTRASQASQASRSSQRSSSGGIEVEDGDEDGDEDDEGDREGEEEDEEDEENEGFMDLDEWMRQRGDNEEHEEL